MEHIYRYVVTLYLEYTLDCDCEFLPVACARPGPTPHAALSSGSTANSLILVRDSSIVAQVGSTLISAAAVWCNGVRSESYAWPTNTT